MQASTGLVWFDFFTKGFEQKPPQVCKEINSNNIFLCIHFSLDLFGFFKTVIEFQAPVDFYSHRDLVEGVFLSVLLHLCILYTSVLDVLEESGI